MIQACIIYLKSCHTALMPILNAMLGRLGADIAHLQEGLDPKTLEVWYTKVIGDAREMAPTWLAEKINVKQDPILTLKFELDISKRAVRYLMAAIEQNADSMPYTTRMYFLKVQESVSSEMDKSLI